MHFQHPPTDNEILSFIEHWIELLADGHYEAAHQHTGHDPYFGWTPELIEAVVHGYGLPESHPSGEVFMVTPIAEAQGGPPQRQIERYDIPSGVLAEVFHSLPLNGEWSDLSATFNVIPANGGANVILQEIHVF